MEPRWAKTNQLINTGDNALYLLITTPTNPIGQQNTEIQLNRGHDGNRVAVQCRRVHIFATRNQ